MKEATAGRRLGRHITDHGAELKRNHTTQQGGLLELGRRNIDSQKVPSKSGCDGEELCSPQSTKAKTQLQAHLAPLSWDASLFNARCLHALMASPPPSSCLLNALSSRFSKNHCRLDAPLQNCHVLSLRIKLPSAWQTRQWKDLIKSLLFSRPSLYRLLLCSSLQASLADIKAQRHREAGWWMSQCMMKPSGQHILPQGKICSLRTREIEEGREPNETKRWTDGLTDKQMHADTGGQRGIFMRLSMSTSLSLSFPLCAHHTKPDNEFLLVCLPACLSVHRPLSLFLSLYISLRLSPSLPPRLPALSC